MPPPLRILFVTPYVPSPLRTRPYGFIKFLAARGHRISLVAAASSPAEPREANALVGLCETVRAVPISPARSLWNCVRAVPRGIPFQAAYSQSPALDMALRDALGGPEPFDLVHVEHLRAVLAGLGVTGVARVFDAVDCITSLFEHAARDAESPFERWRARLDLRRTRRFESTLADRFDAALVTSEADRAALENLRRRPGAQGASDVDGGPRAGPLESAVHFAVVPNGVDLSYFSPSPSTVAGDEVVFVGRMGYHANVAAAVRLAREVMPRVWTRHPATRLTIVGAAPAPAIVALARSDSRVTVTGRVGDVRPYLHRAAVAACPLVYAAGIQNKLLEAMACGTPLVASSAACQGLRVRGEEQLLVADTPDTFATQVLRVLDDPTFGRRLADRGRSYVETSHDWNWVVTRLEELYLGALARHRARACSPGPER